MITTINEFRKINEGNTWTKAKVLEFVKGLVEDGRHGEQAYDIAGSVLDDEDGLKDAIVTYIGATDALGWLANQIA